MNIFVVDKSPVKSAQLLPDRHVTKMIVETCQLLAVIYSPWYYNWGEISKKDGTPYKTAKGSFRNHPCTIWAAKSNPNLAWLITHGLALCDEYEYRYNKKHSSEKTLIQAKSIFECQTGKSLSLCNEVEKFTRAMPDELKYDTSIDDIEAYRRYLNTKLWVSSNYLRKPERLPTWILLNYE